MVHQRCPECGRFTTIGQVFTNMAGQVKTEGWICQSHGDVKVPWEWVDYEVVEAVT